MKLSLIFIAYSTKNLNRVILKKNGVENENDKKTTTIGLISKKKNNNLKFARAAHFFVFFCLQPHGLLTQSPFRLEE